MSGYEAGHRFDGRAGIPHLGGDLAARGISEELAEQFGFMPGQQLLSRDVFLGDHREHVHEWQRVRAAGGLQDQKAVAVLVSDADLPGEVGLKLVADLVDAVSGGLDCRGIPARLVADGVPDRAGPVARGPDADRHNGWGFCRLFLRDAPGR